MRAGVYNVAEHSFSSNFWPLIFSLAAGWVGAFLFYKLYPIFVLLYGAAFGAGLFAKILEDTSIQYPKLVLLIPAILFAVLAFRFQRILIISATAFGGAYQFVTALLVISVGSPIADKLPSPLAVILVLGFVGMLVQFKTAPEES